MFKVIRDFIARPRFLIMCDRSCGTYAVVDVPEAPQQTEDALQAIWARELSGQGWKINLSEHVCPQHMKQESNGKSMILIPSMTAAAIKN